MDLSVAAWLRSDCTISQYPAENPLAQLFEFGEPAIALMAEALQHYLILLEYGPDPGYLRPGYDTLLEVPIERPTWWDNSEPTND